MSEIQFSIIITSYNQREFIKDAVNSALSLRSENKEIIVVDDGSSDGSQDVLRGYGDAIRLVALEANQGRGAARNCGASLATGEYLLFLDGDDAFLPWPCKFMTGSFRRKDLSSSSLRCCGLREC